MAGTLDFDGASLSVALERLGNALGAELHEGETVTIYVVGGGRGSAATGIGQKNQGL